MAKWISLFEAVTKGMMDRKVLAVSFGSDIGKWRMVLTPIRWKPNAAEQLVTVEGDKVTSNKMASWNDDQVFTQEDLGKWYPLEISGKLYAFPEKTTTNLVLCGVRGIQKGPQFMRRVCSLYENLEMGGQAFPMTVQMWKCIPQQYRQEAQWFDTRCDMYDESCVSCNGLQIARDGELLQGLLYKGGNPVLSAYGIRPVIPLKGNIEVDLESDRKNGLALRLPPH